MMLMIFLDLIDTQEEKEKFIKLYNKYVKLVYYTAVKKVHSHELAEECVQETFLYVAKNFHKVGEVESGMTRSYLCTIAEGKAIKIYHKENRAVFVSTDDEETLIDLEDPDANFQTDKINSMDLSFAMDELLTDEERNVLQLKYTYQFKVSEIARMYETTDYFIKKTINGAIVKLKDYVCGEGDER